MKKIYNVILVFNISIHCAQAPIQEKESWKAFFRRKLNALAQVATRSPKDLTTADLEDEESVLISRVNPEITRQLTTHLDTIIKSLDKTQSELEVKARQLDASEHQYFQDKARYDHDIEEQAHIIRELQSQISTLKQQLATRSTTEHPAVAEDYQTIIDALQGSEEKNRRITKEYASIIKENALLQEQLQQLAVNHAESTIRLKEFSSRFTEASHASHILRERYDRMNEFMQEQDAQYATALEDKNQVLRRMGVQLEDCQKERADFLHTLQVILRAIAESQPGGEYSKDFARTFFDNLPAITADQKTFLLDTLFPPVIDDTVFES